MSAAFDFTTVEEYQIINVSPDVTEADVYDKVENENVVYIGDPKDAPLAFVAREVWARGNNSAVTHNPMAHQREIAINPGEHLTVSIGNIARSLTKTMTRDLGMAVILVKPGDDDKTCLKAAISALEKSAKFYRTRGSVQLTKYKRRHQLSDEELSRDIDSTLPYLLNEAKAELLTEHRLKLQREGFPSEARSEAPSKSRSKKD